MIWAGLGRLPNLRQDIPTIAVEFVSAGRRNRERDYVDKRREYMEAGVVEYWIIENFWGPSWGQEGFGHVKMNVIDSMLDKYAVGCNTNDEKKADQPAQNE